MNAVSKGLSMGKEIANSMLGVFVEVSYHLILRL